MGPVGNSRACVTERDSRQKSSDHRVDFAMIASHSASVTGITDRREILTSGKVLKAASALIDASVTGCGSFLTGATSTTDCLPALSFGSGYASPSALAIPTTDFSSPVW